MLQRIVGPLKHWELLPQEKCQIPQDFEIFSNTAARTSDLARLFK